MHSEYPYLTITNAPFTITMMTRKALLVCSLLCLDCWAFAPTAASRRLLVSNGKNHHRLQLKKEPTDDQDSELMNEFELQRQEKKASKESFDRLMLPYRIGTSLNKATYAVVITFLVVNFFLNLGGYSFILKDGGLKIDTLEARQFQQEIHRSVKNPNRGE